MRRKIDALEDAAGLLHPARAGVRGHEIRVGIRVSAGERQRPFRGRDGLVVAPHVVERPGPHPMTEPRVRVEFHRRIAGLQRCLVLVHLPVGCRQGNGCRGIQRVEPELVDRVFDCPFWRPADGLIVEIEIPEHQLAIWIDCLGSVQLAFGARKVTLEHEIEAQARNSVGIARIELDGAAQQLPPRLDPGCRRTAALQVGLGLGKQRVRLRHVGSDETRVDPDGLFKVLDAPGDALQIPALIQVSATPIEVEGLRTASQRLS